MRKLKINPIIHQSLVRQQQYKKSQTQYTNVVVTSNSMLNDVCEKAFSKTQKAKVKKYPGAISEYIFWIKLTIF